MFKQECQDVSILLVEDDDIDAKSVERAFQKMKILNPIYRVKNGIEALAVLRGENKTQPLEKPYIILLDLNMPIMGGIEFLQELRKDPNIQDSVIFVLTTSKAEEDRVAAYEAHIAGYIIKSDIKNGFQELVKMVDHYWRIVALPE